MLKRFQFLGKLVYIINVVAALLLLISFVLPYLAPSVFPTLSILNIAVSPLLLLNIIFGVYWLLHFRKRFWISFIVLLIAYLHFDAFFAFSSGEKVEDSAHSIKVLSYNVRLFNAYEKERDSLQVKQLFEELMASENPDIIFLQEYYANTLIDFSAYPYQFIHYKNEKHKLGHAIFSKYPLLERGAFDFEDTYNNSLYANVNVNGDTLRLYNIHLQSMGILPSVKFLQQRGTEKIKARLSQSFVKQEQQVATILKDKAASNYPVIISGDFNNTVFSYVYRQLKGGMEDAFQERGNGLGTTYFFNGYPMRIDYTLVSPPLKVIDFKTAGETFSDHFPIISTLEIP